ncbi:hypothetical protein VSDG_06596 [Cytospora chrysosperma]|uniref:RWD domain-containing protein n=1 Tax=Cytospora chrysosperma TaxID=252740 RepID=A0A423VNV8_CYTCH|nr:hypothetical protein VSDG_06596 [Valsa sordida]
MSEELADEVEAINSIYGDGSLVRAGGGGDDTGADHPGAAAAVYVLALPDETVSLRLQFPADYPDAPPSVVGTNSAGGRRGVAARDLELFRRALADVYQPGQVCLFDAVEELRRLREEEEGEGEEDGEGLHQGQGQGQGQRSPSPGETAGSGADAAAAGLGPEPPWVLSDPSVELRSTFLARCAAVTSPEQAAGYVRHLLATDRRARGATHNITAWRIRGPGGASYQDCDDDGEAAAGGRLLHLMQLMDLWDAMVVVTRWYGGQKLGPRRFALINAVARDAFVKAGLVREPAAGGKKKGGHGK